jgi:hypothetical protein
MTRNSLLVLCARFRLSIINGLEEANPGNSWSFWVGINVDILPIDCPALLVSVNNLLMVKNVRWELRAIAGLSED